jgi:hypothetical protein
VVLFVTFEGALPYDVNDQPSDHPETKFVFAHRNAASLAKKQESGDGAFMSALF